MDISEDRGDASTKKILDKEVEDSKILEFDDVILNE